jgi:hypothetical protein
MREGHLKERNVPKRAKAAALTMITKIKNNDEDNNKDDDDEAATLGPMARDEDEDKGEVKAKKKEVK